MLPSVPLSESVTAVQLLRECEEKALSADRLLKRGAAFAARADVIEALRSFAAAKDMQHGGRTATDAFDAAINAIREAGDFMGRYGNVDRQDVARMVASHETEILKNVEISDLTPHAAADMYLDFARQNLTTLVSGHNQGARLLLLLANAEKSRKSADSNVSDSIAITCLRAAVGASPQDPLLASELGFHALRAGKLDEARWALERSLAVQPSTPALQNLAETYRLAGDLERAKQLASRLSDVKPASTRSMLVTTVPAATFAELSPPVQSQIAVPSQFSSTGQGVLTGERIAMQPPSQQQPQNRQLQNSTGTAAQGFHNGPQPPVSHTLAPNSNPNVFNRMTSAVKNVWR